MAAPGPLPSAAAIAGPGGLNLPRPRRRYRFALTPLADAMFQLLIFFMLSSSLTPYSLLTMQSAPAPGGAAGAAASPSPEAAAPGASGATALWRLEAGQVVTGGQRFDFAALPDLGAALNVTGAPPAQVILLITPGARVQDVATVLAGLTAAGISAVQLAPEGS